MNIYIQLTLVALIVIFIVDISGFTQTVLDIISAAKHKKVESFKPFTCSLCMVWWTTLIYSLCVGCFNLGTIAFSALLSALSFPLGNAFIFIRELINKAIRLITDWAEL